MSGSTWFENGLAPGGHQAITWISHDLLSIGPSGTNFSEIAIKIETFSFKKMHLNLLPAKCRPFCSGLNVLMVLYQWDETPLLRHWFRQWLVAWPAPRHYLNLNQCWNIVNWTLRNKLLWRLNWNSYIFMQENAFENVVWKMAACCTDPYQYEADLKM